jgi:hypothetical protein
MAPPRTYAAPLLALALLAGCGGGSPEAETQVVRGPGFAYEAPASWEVRRTPRAAEAEPDAGSGELVSVTRFPLARRFRPALWPEVVGELDRVAGELSERLGGEILSSKTARIGGLRGRSYVIAYRRDGDERRQRIAFLLRGRGEYQLLCTWRETDGEPPACELLEKTFTPS